MVKLGEVASYINGYAFKPEDRGSEGLPIIRIQDLTGNSYDLGYYSGNYPKKIEINDGDILISWSASLGVYTWNKGKALLNQHIFKVEFIEDSIDKKYFVYAVRKKIDEMIRKSHGATMKHIIKKDFEDTIIPYPTLEEQYKIADELDRISKIIDMRNQELRLNDDLIRARFVEMFGDIQIEEKYKNIKLKEICNTISGGTPSTRVKEYYNGEIPWITTVSLGDNYINGVGAKAHITKSAIDNSATKLIPAGNILFGTRVGVGKSSINLVDLCTNQDIVAIIDIDTNKFDRLFIKHVLDMNQPYYDSLKKGATILGITSEDLKDSIIPNVPIEIQNKFSAFVLQIDKSKFIVKNHIVV